MEHSFLDEYSHTDSIVHRLEPRIKIVCLFLFIFFVAFQNGYTFQKYAAYGLVILSLCAVSRIPLRFIFKRVFSLLPFIVMIAICIPFIKSADGTERFSFGLVNLPVSYQGAMLFVSIVIKAGLSIIAMTLLMASTDFSCLLKALEKLRVPAVLIMIISFMYRYVFVLEDELMKMRLAKDCRTVGGSRWFHLKAQANMLGVLFIRAYERAEKVYLAMCARGFDGQMRTLYEYKVTAKDMFFLFVFSGILILISYY